MLKTIQPAIFNDLAQEAVSLCRASLLNAADALGAKSAFDGQLFLVRHLLILRDIARNVDLAQKDEPRAGGTADAYTMTGAYFLVYTNHLGESALMGHHHRHPIFHAVAHIDAPARRALHIPPRCPCRTPLGRKARTCLLLFPWSHAHPMSTIGHRPRPKARLRDRHLHRIRAALRTPARIHRPPSLSRRSCRARRRVPHCVRT